jgi:hypothetical protein
MPGIGNAEHGVGRGPRLAAQPACSLPIITAAGRAKSRIVDGLRAPGTAA